MLFLQRNGLALRGVALFLTAYCVLASGRALIPGLCTTLADLDQKNTACCTPGCHSEGRASGTSLTASAHVCAFCMLIHTAAQPLALETLSAPTISAPHRLAAYDDYVADPTSAGCFLRRAPPLA